jgi:hypothetical protein
VAAFALGRTLHFAHSSVLYCVCCKILFGWYDLMRARESETGVSDSCLALDRALHFMRSSLLWFVCL